VKCYIHNSVCLQSCIRNINTRANRGVESLRRVSFQELVLFRSVPPLFSLELWGRFLVRGVWFLAVYRWRKPIVSKNFGRNQWPTVPRVNYRDMKDASNEKARARREGEQAWCDDRWAVKGPRADTPLDLGLLVGQRRKER
jgi:hypothetical protein